MKTKTTLQRTALTLGLSFTAAASVQAQVDGSNGVILGGDSTLGRITAAETITDISDYGVGVFPQGWRTPFLDIANLVAPVSQFTGVNNDGTNVATLDLIPLRTTSLQLVDPVTNVITAVDGKNLYNSNGTLTGSRTVSQGGYTLGFTGGETNFRAAGAANGITMAAGTGPTTNSRIFSFDPIEIQSGNLPFQLYLRPAGGIGIGTNNPIYPLHVATLNGVHGSSARSYFSGTSTSFSVDTGASGNISIFSSGWMCSDSGYLAHSDSRLKNIIGVTDTSIDLKTLSQIEITDYTKKDVVADSGKYKKAIAQQIQSVYPQAVSVTSDFIPNVYEAASKIETFGNLTKITTIKPHEFRSGDLVKIATEAQGEKRFNVVVLDEHTFSVNEELEAGRVFVYGKQVDDLLAVDYEALFTLNISATQELAKKSEAQEIEINGLKAENAKLTASLSKLEALEIAVAALEGKSTESVTVSLTK